MTEIAPRTTFVSLPTELRLQIAAYALEQEPDAGLLTTLDATFEQRTLVTSVRSLEINPFYPAAPDLSILLVCRQFRTDFTCLAFQRTRFLLDTDPAGVIANQSDELLQNVRKLAIQCDLDAITSWDKFPFNKECMKLDELSIGLISPPDDLDLVELLRRLQNVKALRFLRHKNQDWAYWEGYMRLLRELVREDLSQRYAAPYAPDLGSTWWQWTYMKEENSFTLVAQEPNPVMEDEEYMLLVKPMIDGLVKATEA